MQYARKRWVSKSSISLLSFRTSFPNESIFSDTGWEFNKWFACKPYDWGSSNQGISVGTPGIYPVESSSQFYWIVNKVTSLLSARWLQSFEVVFLHCKLQTVHGIWQLTFHRLFSKKKVSSFVVIYCFALILYGNSRR